jgi:undecaprenyl-diphosphatase
MRTLVLLALFALVFTAAAAAMPYFPGDLAVTRAVQAAIPAGPWAASVTASAGGWWKYGLAAVGALVAWRLADWRGALIVVLLVAALPPAGDWIKTLVARPRPSSALVRVVGNPTGFSYPSTAGLVYGSIFGVLALLALDRRRPRLTVAALCLVGLLIGAAARIVMGAHWPSDLLGAYVMAIASAMALRAILPAPHVRMRP